MPDFDVNAEKAAFSLALDSSSNQTFNFVPVGIDQSIDPTTVRAGQEDPLATVKLYDEATEEAQDIRLTSNGPTGFTTQSQLAGDGDYFVICQNIKNGNGQFFGDLTVRFNITAGVVTVV